MHVAVRERERVLQTTRADEGGSGVPRAFVLGKGRRAPRAWELALLGDRPKRSPLIAAARVHQYDWAAPTCLACQLSSLTLLSLRAKVKRVLVGSHPVTRPARPAQPAVFWCDLESRHHVLC